MMPLVTDELREALELIHRHGERSHFVGRRDEHLVLAAEERLGITFPVAYRRFVLRLGAGSFGAAEFYGLIDTDFSGLPDAVWVTLQSREEPSRLPSTMVVVGEDGMGGDYVLDAAKGTDPPVEVWSGGISDSADELEQVAGSFGLFVLHQVRAQLER